MRIEKASFPHPYPRNYFEELYQQYPEGFIVAENKKRIIGYIVGRVKDNSGEIVSLAVDLAWRRKGIGKKLINFLTTHFKEKRLKEISLCVRTRNQGAITFYKKFGFEILKTIKNYYPNGDDAYLMKKKI